MGLFKRPTKRSGHLGVQVGISQFKCEYGKIYYVYKYTCK